MFTTVFVGDAAALSLMDIVGDPANGLLVDRTRLAAEDRLLGGVEVSGIDFWDASGEGASGVAVSLGLGMEGGTRRDEAGGVMFGSFGVELLLVGLVGVAWFAVKLRDLSGPILTTRLRGMPGVPFTLALVLDVRVVLMLRMLPATLDPLIEGREGVPFPFSALVFESGVLR